MRLLLIRHGQSANNELYARTGDWTARDPDPVLTQAGTLQVDLLADAFDQGLLPRPDVLITSLMRRAVLTARPLAERLDIPVEGHLELNEVGGVYEGVYPDARPATGAGSATLLKLCDRLVLPAGVDEQGWHRRGLETPAQAWQRARGVMEELLARFRQRTEADGVLALVGHAWMTQYLLRAVMNLPPEPDGLVSPWFELHNTGTCLLDLGSADSADAVQVVWMNRTDHLTGELLTL